MMTSSPAPDISPLPGKAGSKLRWVYLLLAIVTASSGTWLAQLQIDQPLTGIDDANIFFTYASNLAEGQGFVYSDGGERVEGFTSLLWTLVCTLAFLVSSRPEPLLFFTSCILLAIAIYQSSQFLAESIQSGPRKKEIRWIVPTMMLMLCAWALATPRFMVWTTVTLMDTGLWCTVLTCGTIAFARAARHDASGWREDRGLVGWTIAMLLTRPEAMLIVLVWIGSLAVVRLGASSDRTRGSLPGRLWINCRVPLVGYLFALGALTLFRLIYFGFPLPNTYYAKVSPNLFYNLKLGGGYFLTFIGSQLFIIPALMVVIHGGWQALRRTLRRQSHDDPGLVVLVAALLCSLAIPVITGGDHFNLFRFFQPCWLLLALPLLVGIGRLLGRLRRLHDNPLWAIATLAGMTVLFYSIQFPRWNELGKDEQGKDIAGIQVEFQIAAKGRLRGELLSDLFAGDNVSIGVGTAGGIGLTYQGRVIDLLGLNNVAMGHSPGDRKGGKNHAAFNKEVFFEQLPDVVRPTLIMSHQPVPENLDQFLPGKGLFWDTALDGLERSSTRFLELYRPIVIERQGPAGEQLHLRAWCRPHVVELLRKKGTVMREIEN